MKLMTCRHHLHLNLTRQGHAMIVKLEHTILSCDCIHCLLEFFPCRYLTLAPDTAEETFVEISDTEPEDSVGAATTTLPGKGRSVSLPYNFLLTLPSCSLERCLILSTL